MKDDHSGHRERLRRRLRVMDSFSPEPRMSLEALLFSPMPRRDMTDLSQRLLTRFGSFRGIFSQSRDSLTQTEGVGGVSANYIAGYGALMRRYAVEYAASQPLTSDFSIELLFCRISVESGSGYVIALALDEDDAVAYYCTSDDGDCLDCIKSAAENERASKIAICLPDRTIAAEPFAEAVADACKTCAGIFALDGGDCVRLK